jgi:hypothetical protein
MKQLEEIIKQEPIYLNDWKENKRFGLISDFDNIYMGKEEYEAKTAPYSNVKLWEEKKLLMKNAIERWKPINILFASYSYIDYYGNAFVLFERDGKLFEVNGSHCSCYGLEGQFEPEETTLEALKHRLIKGKLGQHSHDSDDFSNELKQFLGF